MPKNSKSNTTRKVASAYFNEQSLSILGTVLSYFYNVMIYHFPGAMLMLVLMTLTGVLITKDGLFLVLGILIFIALHYFVKWYEKNN